MSAKAKKLRRHLRSLGLTPTKPAWRVVKKHDDWQDRLHVIAHKDSMFLVTDAELNILSRQSQAYRERQAKEQQEKRLEDYAALRRVARNRAIAITVPAVAAALVIIATILAIYGELLTR